MDKLATRRGPVCRADLTPFSPGANDDASGVGVILALAERLIREPLAHTEVWLVLTGCEEVSSYGMTAFLDAHAAELGDDTAHIILDIVGAGKLGFLTTDGLIVKRATHGHALELARQAAAALPDLRVEAHAGVATKRGLIALTVDTVYPPGKEDVSHWHQMSDTPDRLDAQTLADAHSFTWQVLREIDRVPAGMAGRLPL